MHAASMRAAAAVLVVVGLASTAAADDHARAAGAAGEYTHAAALDGGAVLAWWREPLGADLAIDGALGVVIATHAGTTAASLTNPRVRARYRATVALALSLELTLPAASRRGDGGAVAAAMAAAHRDDPAPWLAGGTTLAAGLHRRWPGPRGELAFDAGFAWTVRADAADLPLVHVDASGAVRLLPATELTARLRTTGYGLVADSAEDFVHTLALGARYRDRCRTIELALEVPVDDVDRAADVVRGTVALTMDL